MLKNHFKVALRNLSKHKGYSFINIVGLAVGIACCLIIVLFVRDESSYEKFHPSAERVVRITYLFNNPQAGVATANASSPNIVASWLKENFPEVRHTTRLFRPYPQETYIAFNEKVFHETELVFADSNFFKVFDGYRARSGNLAAALSAPHTLVITAKMAKKYFGAEDPIGKYLKINNRTERQVTAVLEEPAGKSHLDFDFLAADLGIGHAYDMKWDSPNFYTYALLRDPAAARTLKQSMNRLLDSKVVELGVQPLRDIHLRSQLVGELQPNSNIRYLYAFSFIAILILGIACINYVNLATARAMERAKEVGILKVMGVHRAALFWKFLFEVVIEIIPALILALVLVEATLPWFNQLTSKAVSLTDIPFIGLLGAFAILLIVVSLLAGAYPAFALSGFQPAQVVKGKIKASRHGVALRKTLVVLQFAVSIFLIGSAIVVYRQLQFVQEKSLGYDKEHVLIAKLDRPQFADKIDLLRNEFRALPQVAAVGASMISPLAVPVAGTGIHVKSVTDETRYVSLLAVDEHFLATMELSLIAGSNFTLNPVEGQERQLIANETFVRSLNLTPEQALGTRVRVLYWGEGEGTIVGIVKDFHTRSLHREIEPLLLYQNPSGYARLLIRLQPGNPQPVLQALERLWKKVAPAYPFVYEFLDREYDALYRLEQRVGTLVQVFTGLAILVACFGLYGLASYSTVQRTKEIGVRKVLGATVVSIVGMLSSEIFRLIVIAFVLAAPFTFYIANKWLSGFAYRIELEWWIFGMAALAATLMALLTNIQQSLRAALANPVEALRYE